MIAEPQLIAVDAGAPAPAVVVMERSLQRVVVSEHAGAIALCDAPATPRLVQDSSQRTMAKLVEDRPRVLTAGFVGPRGVQGVKGDPGGVAALSLPIGAVVQGLRVVRSDAGTVFPVNTASATDADQVIGVALQSVTVIGTAVQVQSMGPVTDSSWAWAPGIVWCGPDGTLTQNPAATGWLMQVGRVLSPTQIDVDIEQPIYRG